MRLDESGKFDDGNFSSILQTICGMANTVPRKDSFIYLGVADKLKDAERAKKLHKIEPVEFAGRYIVGVDHEADRLSETLDRYVERIRNKIQDSSLSEYLVVSVLQRLDVFRYHNLHIVRIGVPGQSQLSFFDDECYVRQASSTIKLKNSQIPAVAAKFDGA